MKKALPFSFLLVFLLCFSTQISFAQCGNSNTWSGTYLTPDTIGSTTTLSYLTGQYALAYVTPGATYTVSTCGSSSFDTQLTVYDMAGTFIAYNDDYCGLQSTVSFTASTCGYVKVLLHQYSCNSSGLAANVSMTQTGGGTAAPKVKVNTVPSLVLCAGDSVLLYGTSNSNNMSYTWSPGFTNNTYIKPTGGIYYVVTGTDNVSGCSKSDSITFTVNPLPAVTANSSGPTTICLKESALLYGSGTSNVTYSWTGGIADNTTFTPSAAGTFDYILTGTAQSTACKNKDTITLTVNALPVVTAISANGSTAFCAGDSATLYGAGANTYAWTGGITNNTKFPAAAGDYVVTGTDLNNCVNKDTITLSINPLPAVGTNASATRVCLGQDVTLNGTGAVSYTWTGGVNDNVPFAPAATATYKVKGTDANGCSDTTSVHITVDLLPVVTANSTTPDYCPGEGVTLYGGGAVSYVWTNGVSDNVVFYPAATNTYTVTGTDANGCENTADVTVTQKNLPDVTTTLSGYTITALATGATYQWLEMCGNGDALISGATGQSYTPTVSGSYSVQVTLNGCTDTSSCETVIATGIQTGTASAAFIVYPNPNAGSFAIRSSVEGSYTLVNELGQAVATFTVDGTETPVAVEGLKAGIYTIVGVNKDQVINKKIVVSR